MKGPYFHKYDMYPDYNDTFYCDEVEEPLKPVTLNPVFTGDTFKHTVQYPVIVESWEHKKDGSKRRKYFETFSEKERKTIGRWHTKFYRWYLVTGTPQRVMLNLKTLELLRRAVDFFATI